MGAKSFFWGAFASLLVFALYFSVSSSGGCAARADAVFSPNSEGEVLGLVRSAQKSVDLEMYVFTSEEAALELADAAGRGVRVRVILEKRADSYNLKEIVGALLDAGVEVRWASFDYKLTHSKMMVLDGERVFVGSTNFSNSALNLNREMAVLLEGEVVGEFARGFERDWEMATPAG